MNFNLKKLSRSLVAIPLLFSAQGYANNGITKTEIKIGMSNATSGPAEGLGNGVKMGAETYFKRVNDAGGVHGRKIVINHYDDGYEPKRTIANVKKLMAKDKVFALFGFVGTPTSKAVVPKISKAKMPYIGPFTGAEFLRTPLKENIINFRASYFMETEELVKFFTSKGHKKIAIFVQNDGYGNAGKSGVVKALRKRKLKLAAEGRYTRNTTDVSKGVAKVLKGKPDAIIMVGAYKATGKAVKEIRKTNKTVKIANISFVGTNNLISEMGKLGEGTYISQVMPSPTNSDLEIVKQYREDMKKAGGEVSYTTLEGYIDAYLFVEALKKAGKNVTQKSLIATFQKMNGNYGGLKLGFSKKSHQGLKSVFLTEVKNGKAQEF